MGEMACFFKENQTNVEKKKNMNLFFSSPKFKISKHSIEGRILNSIQLPKNTGKKLTPKF
jgi:hypothetical protein